MESLPSLQNQLDEKEKELEKITVKEYGSTPWAPGVQDQYESNSYSNKRYTDPEKAHRLQSEIEKLKYKIYHYAELATEERNRETANKERQIPKYNYTHAGKNQQTRNNAIAARYNAQQRFFQMSKLQQTIAKLTGQYKRFQTLWNKADYKLNPHQQEQIAQELDKMFKGR